MVLIRVAVLVASALYRRQTRISVTVAMWVSRAADDLHQPPDVGGGVRDDQGIAFRVGRQLAYSGSRPWRFCTRPAAVIWETGMM